MLSYSKHSMHTDLFLLITKHGASLSQECGAAPDPWMICAQMIIFSLQISVVQCLHFILWYRLVSLGTSTLYNVKLSWAITRSGKTASVKPHLILFQYNFHPSIFYTGFIPFGVEGRWSLFQLGLDERCDTPWRGCPNSQLRITN